MFEKEFGFIGIGKMGKTLLEGALKVTEKEKIIIHDVNKSLLDERSKEYDIDQALSNLDVVEKAKNVIIAVLPQVIDNVLKEISEKLQDNQILISIAAGVSIDHIEKNLKKEIGIIRVMPNAPALVGEGATALSHNDKVKMNDLEYIINLFKAVGLVVQLNERHLDAVTGLSGSGPAYIFIIIEALADGGVKMGLPRDIATKLAAQTVLGSAKMVIDTGLHPAVLKDKVASPGGTTITAIHQLELSKIRATMISAVEAATLKSRSMK
ncbi:MAG: pyrroline-5-carboxylate reductase [Candidatus Lokiarchaeota archaeon]|nr:pyrroline-5-carboxylate reductase [Candidatus Lokiarchaeota archaeon]